MNTKKSKVFPKILPVLESSIAVQLRRQFTRVRRETIGNMYAAHFNFSVRVSLLLSVTVLLATRAASTRESRDTEPSNLGSFHFKHAAFVQIFPSSSRGGSDALWLTSFAGRV